MALRLTMLVLKVPHAASQCGGWKELQLRLCTRKRCALHGYVWSATHGSRL